MIPTNTGSTSPCSNISSNCVVWQGPDIPCINLCNGDTISDVIAKLAEELCALTNAVASEPDLSGLDLLCVLPDGQSDPTSLEEILQLIINAVCGVNSETLRYSLPDIQLGCLAYGSVTALPLDEYAVLVGNKVCDILSTITIIQTTLSNHESRLIVLENCVLPCSANTVNEAQVISSCVLPGGSLVNASVLLLAIETAFCNLQNAVGTPALISTAINAQCIFGNDTLLSGTGTYSSIPGWVTNVNTLAESNKNLWLVVCDMYKAIQDIQLNCCPGACDSVTFGYTTSVVNNPVGIPQNLNLNFTTSSIPAAYNDCAGSTSVSIIDSFGVSSSTTVNVTSLQNNPAGVSIPFGSLNPYGNLTINVDFCVTDGKNTCSEKKTSSVISEIPCPPSINTTNITTDSVDVTFSNYLGVTATYVITAEDTATGIITATETVNSPGATVLETLTGLASGTEYSISVSVTINGSSKICAGPSFETNVVIVSPTCDNGLDVVFLLDYTSSMGSAIDTIKAGISSTISTIQTESGTNDYRLALVLADEGSTSTATYSDSTDYLALPAAQRVVNAGIDSRYQYITAVEKFATNNSASFTTQLNKINTGAAPTNWPIGIGVGGAEPTDMALGFVVESNVFAGTFRTGVAKYVLIYTDDFPSGNDDVFNDTDVARLNSLAQTCLTQGIKCFVLGPGTSLTYTPSGGTPIYPWRNLATTTGGAWDVSYATTTVNSLIVNACTPT
jgi:hypothetical protein